MTSRPVIEEVRDKFRTIITENKLGEELVQVKIGTLTVKQAIGEPNRRDYPLIEGREVMITVSGIEDHNERVKAVKRTSQNHENS